MWEKISNQRFPENLAQIYLFQYCVDWLQFRSAEKAKKRHISTNMYPKIQDSGQYISKILVVYTRESSRQFAGPQSCNSKRKGKIELTVYTSRFFSVIEPHTCREVNQLVTFFEIAIAEIRKATTAILHVFKDIWPKLLWGRRSWHRSKLLHLNTTHCFSYLHRFAL